MSKAGAVSVSRESGQVTIIHLLSMIALFMPVATAMTELERSGGGAVRYLVVIPLGLSLGALIELVDWKLGMAIWTGCQQRSKRAQGAAAITLFLLKLLAIVVGSASGFKMAVLVALHFPH